MTPERFSKIEFPALADRVTFPVVRIAVPTAPVPFRAMLPPALTMIFPPATALAGEPILAPAPVPGVRVTPPPAIRVISVFTPPAPLDPITAGLLAPPTIATLPVTFKVRLVAPGVTPPRPPIRAPAKVPVLADPVIDSPPFTVIDWLWPAEITALESMPPAPADRLIVPETIFCVPLSAEMFTPLERMVPDRESPPLAPPVNVTVGEPAIVCVPEPVYSTWALLRRPTLPPVMFKLPPLLKVRAWAVPAAEI